MTDSVRTSAANGSKSSRNGRPMAQPTKTITGSTKIAICVCKAADVNSSIIDMHYVTCTR